MTLCKSKRRQVRARSLGGCGTCRTRHTKCDETRPYCQVCLGSGLMCDGYEIRLVFDRGDMHGSRCRRPLFSVKTRQHMSEQLTASANPQDIDHYIDRIDEECEKPEQEISNGFAANAGPFGAFRVSGPLVTLYSQSPQPSLPTLSHQHQIEDSLPLPFVLDESQMADLSNRINAAETDDSLMELLFLDADVSIDLSRGDFFSSYSSGHLGDELHSPPMISNSSSHHVLIENTCMNSPSSSLLPPPVHNLAPDDSNFLLSQYRNNIVHLFSPIYSHKTPWQIMHVPNAMETLGQLAMGELAPNARMCIFYAILATTAFALKTGNSSEPSMQWQKKGETYTGQAQIYLKLAFQDISSASKKVKYKDMLMALLCMATVSAFQGNETRIESCLLDCEQWIFLRGLPKTKKSRKVRLLHHCYVQLRVFHESTSIGRKPDSPLSTKTGRFFSVQRWEARFHQRMSDPKEGLLAENDLHLEVPGRMKSTMYPLIYGIPENLLFLLAQTTRLANEKDLLEGDESTKASELQQFWARARSLERYICDWQPTSSVEQDDGEHETNSNNIDQARAAHTPIERRENEILDHYVSALHKALLLFFYRRIHDMHPAIMQDQVRHIRDSLSRCDEFDIPAVRFAAGFVWVAFIAACEALDQSLRDWFCTWFDTSKEKSGLPMFQIAKNTAIQAWKKDNQTSQSWPQVVRSNNQNIFYL